MQVQAQATKHHHLFEPFLDAVGPNMRKGDRIPWKRTRLSLVSSLCHESRSHQHSDLYVHESLP
jgi:hypothetical protein